MDPALRALFTLHEGLPRGGPGSDRATREVLGRLPALPAAPRIVDMGCGPGLPGRRTTNGHGHGHGHEHGSIRS